MQTPSDLTTAEILDPVTAPNTEHLNASAQLLYVAATTRGVQCKTFPGTQLLEMSLGDKRWRTIGSRPFDQSAIGQTIADNKTITKVLLKEAGAPTAAWVTVNNETELEKINSLHFPLVMKPLDGAHGRGVIVGLIDFAAASAAFTAAKAPMLFEEMLQGQEYRIVCVNYTFVAAAFRQPAQVTGDGQHTIEELIVLKNQHPWRSEGHRGKLTKITIDDQVLATLTDQGLTLTSQPAENQVVYLRKTANLSTGGEAWNVTEQVCPENQALFARIAQECMLNVIGIDVMCTDLSQPITQQPGAGIIEINKSPGLRMHHFPLRGEPVDVAGKIMDMIFQKLSLTAQPTAL
jgi:cyanophycin synthetase